MRIIGELEECNIIEKDGVLRSVWDNGQISW